MTDYFDKLETRDPREREQAMLAALPKHIAHAKANAPGFARILKGVDATIVTSRDALARLPVTRKSDLKDLQRGDRPLGGLNATPVGKLAKIFVSPGQIYDPEGHGTDWWRTARALHAAGFRAGDIVVNTFAYHFTPAGSMLESGALALGCTVVPTGVGQTEMQVATIADLGANAYIGTPSFLKLIMEKADESKVDVACLKKAMVGAEYLPPALREAMRARGMLVAQCYATADLGLIAYESLMPDGTVVPGMIADEGIIIEIVRPGTGDPVPAGDVGEVVVTTFNSDYPLIRFGTGDLSAVLPEASPCGRTNVRIKGWMGRADQTTKVKAMFVTPSQVAEVVGRHREILKARLVVDQAGGQDRMTLRCEVLEGGEAVLKAVIETIRDVTKLRGEVAIVKPGELPNDGKVIDDIRKYD
jgi:phenylacetate-coenzyme A ligase PaaK-like adenylate-forming protein